MFGLYADAPCTSCQSTQAENAQLTATPRMVTVCAPARPTWRPNRPATIAPSSGASTMSSRCVVESSIDRLPLEQIDVGDVDRAPVAEQRYQDRQSDRRLGGRNGEDEEHEHLPRGLAELARERHEVDVDRQQH